MELDKLRVLNFICDNLPHSLDMKPNGKITPDVHSWGEMGYFENEELTLQVVYSPNQKGYSIHYYSDADEYHFFQYVVDNNTTITDLRKMFKECFDIGLVAFQNWEKRLIAEIQAEEEIK